MSLWKVKPNEVNDFSNSGVCYGAFGKLSLSINLEADITCAPKFRVPQCNYDPTDINCGGVEKYQLFKWDTNLIMSDFTKNLIRRPAACNVLKNIAVNVVRKFNFEFYHFSRR